MSYKNLLLDALQTHTPCKVNILSFVVLGVVSHGNVKLSWLWRVTLGAFESLLLFCVWGNICSTPLRSYAVGDHLLIKHGTQAYPAVVSYDAKSLLWSCFKLCSACLVLHALYLYYFNLHAYKSVLVITSLVNFCSRAYFCLRSLHLRLNRFDWFYVALGIQAKWNITTITPACQMPGSVLQYAVYLLFCVLLWDSLIWSVGKSFHLL